MPDTSRTFSIGGANQTRMNFLTDPSKPGWDDIPAPIPRDEGPDWEEEENVLADN